MAAGWQDFGLGKAVHRAVVGLADHGPRNPQPFTGMYDLGDAPAGEVGDNKIEHAAGGDFAPQRIDRFGERRLRVIDV